MMSDKHVFKYYANRKLYNTETKKLSNHCEILESLKTGKDVRVIYNETGDDVTHHTLFQMLISKMNLSPEYVIKICKVMLLADTTQMEKFKNFIDELVITTEKENV
jgi:polyhydroxyalkanoate synthesis regulator protein